MVQIELFRVVLKKHLRFRGANTRCKPQAHSTTAADSARSGRCLPRKKRLRSSPIRPPCECECTRSKRKRRRLPSDREGSIGCSRGRAGQDCARLPGEDSVCSVRYPYNHRRAPEAIPACTGGAGRGTPRRRFLFHRHVPRGSRRTPNRITTNSPACTARDSPDAKPKNDQQSGLRRAGLAGCQTKLRPTEKRVFICRLKFRTDCPRATCSR